MNKGQNPGPRTFGDTSEVSMSWIELARTSFTPGPSPVPDFFCSPWTNFGPPDKPQYYVASGQPYTFDVPAGKQATHLQVWAISYRHKNWITDIAWAEFDGQPHNMTDWVTSDSGTCANLHFEQKLDGSAKHSIKLLDAAGDAQFLISHARIQHFDVHLYLLVNFCVVIFVVYGVVLFIGIDFIANVFVIQRIDIFKHTFEQQLRCPDAYRQWRNDVGYLDH
ncbi:hypothetical protein EXIGLDRAFT_701301 [Exidia glandulosa HHB12029]|uniref:Uncharacterized protein n=1 Tax=Exidia glandulosa HHB12029 TaxID=1314781 RepID=A0A165D008_EXIGL|nr:hypothetical protein EXIGLDRAFT_701301 [Exidia glandulosa HHB12029]